MATQAYIIDAESRLPDIDATEVASAFRHELRLNGNGHPYPENRDCWGTLWLNTLRHVKSHPSLKVLSDALAQEFDH